MKTMVGSPLLAIAYLPNPCSALIISSDYLNVGDGLITKDIDNSREWLDVSHTVGMSTSTALSFYSQDGFRLATAQEVVSLYVSAGIDEVLNFGTNPPSAVVGSNTAFDNVTSAIGKAATADLFSKLGWTSSAFGGNPYIHGYMADEDADGKSYLSRIKADSYGDPYRLAHIQTNGDNWSATVQSGAIGSFLVRDVTPVPEPSTYAMFGTAFFMLGFAGYRARNRKS